MGLIPALSSLPATGGWASAPRRRDEPERRVRRVSGAGNASVNSLDEHERNSGLELLTRLNGGFRPRLVAWIAAMIQTNATRTIAVPLLEA